MEKDCNSGFEDDISYIQRGTIPSSPRYEIPYQEILNHQG
jgi:hypothetical protein